MRSGGTQHPAEIMNFLASVLVTVGGIIDYESGGFLVSEEDTPEMGVQIAMGRAYIPQSDGLQAFPVWSHTDDAHISLSANGAGNARKDAIVLIIDKTVSPPSYTVDDVGMIVVVEGNPAPSPVAPDNTAIQSAIGASNPYIRLANITVGAGVTEITDANIVDLRTNARMTIFSPQINVGGDAENDLLYRAASGLLARLGLGTNGEFLGVVADALAWSNPAPKFFVGETSYNLTSDNVDLGITGCPFEPKFMLLFAAADTTGGNKSHSIGFGYPAVQKNIQIDDKGFTRIDVGGVDIGVVWRDAPATDSIIHLSAFTGDGATLHITKNNSPTGTGRLFYAFIG